MKNRLPLFLGFLLLVLYIALMPLYFPTIITSDTLECGYQVEKALNDPDHPLPYYLYNPAHLLQNPLYYGVGKILANRGYHGFLIFHLQWAAVIFGFFTLLLAYLLNLRLLKDPLSAFIGTLFLGLTYGFWLWSGQIKAYPIAFFFCLLAFFFLASSRSRWAPLLSTASSATAVGFSFAASPLIAVLTLFILTKEKISLKTLLRALSYALLSVLLIVLLFLGASAILLKSAIFSRANAALALNVAASTISMKTPKIFTPGFMSGNFTSSSRLSSLALNLMDSIVAGMNGASKWASKWLRGLLAVNACVLLFLFIFTLRRLWAKSRQTLMFSLAWLFFFGASFFLGDPENGFVYVLSFAVALLLAALCAASRAGKTAAIFFLALLMIINISQIRSLHHPDERIADCDRIHDIVRPYDVFIGGIIPHYYGRSPYLNYCRRITFLMIKPGELESLKEGILPSGLADEISTWLKRERRVFLSRSCVELALGERKLRENFWKALRSGFIISDSFTIPPHPEMAAENFVRIEKK
ncbi:MAG: hypothetical protein V2A78_03590 [bacterium]